MSWTIFPEIKSQPITAAKEALAAQTYVPQPIKDYLVAGIDGLEKVHGADVLVTVTGNGHLCTGEDYDVTSATVEVRKG